MAHRNASSGGRAFSSVRSFCCLAFLDHCAKRLGSHALYCAWFWLWTATSFVQHAPGAHGVSSRCSSMPRDRSLRTLTSRLRAGNTASRQNSHAPRIIVKISGGTPPPHAPWNIAAIPHTRLMGAALQRYLYAASILSFGLLLSFLWFWRILTLLLPAYAPSPLL